MSKVTRRMALLLLTLACSGGAWAEGNAPSADAPPSPDANAGESAISPEPEIHITHRGRERVEEYKINNRVYMIKVTPAKGPPYYLIDTTGDGSFDTRVSGYGPKISVPQWVLFGWK